MGMMPEDYLQEAIEDLKVQLVSLVGLIKIPDIETTINTPQIEDMRLIHTCKGVEDEQVEQMLELYMTLAKTREMIRDLSIHAHFACERLSGKIVKRIEQLNQ